MANLKQAFEYASQNPDSDFAKNLEQLAASGSLNGEAKKYGIDLTPFRPAPTLASKLGQRAKDFGTQVATLGTLGANTVDPNTIPENRNLAALGGLAQAGVAPFKMAGAVGGAVGDIVGAGLQATGLDKPLGEALAPIAQSDIAQKAVQAFQALPPEYQDYLKTGMDVTNLAGLGVGKKAVTTGLEAGASTIKPAIEAGATSALKAVTPDASAIMQRVARIPKQKQIKFQNTAGESVGEYLTKRGVYGDEEQIVEQLYKRFTDSKKVADDALEQLPGTYKPQQVADALDMLEEKFTKSSTKGVKDPNLSRVEELIAKYNAEGLTMPEVNEAKRLFEKNAKLDFARENNPDGIRLANNVDNSIREWQFNQAEKLGLKNLPEINRETRLARQLMDDLGAESAGIAGNNAVSLTDWIVLAEGNPASIAAFLGKKAASSKKIQSAVAKRVAGKPTVGQPEAIFTDAKKTTSLPEQKLLQQSSPQSTPTVPKSKGIRGMVSLDAKNYLPEKPVINTEMRSKAYKAIDKSAKVDIPAEVISKANKFSKTQKDMTDIFLSDTSNKAYIEDFRKMVGYEGFDPKMSQQKLEVLASQFKEAQGLSVPKKKVVSREINKFPEILNFKNPKDIIPIKQNGKIVGGIDATVNRSNPERLDIHFVRIIPEAQGKGLGTQAVEQLFKDNPSINQLVGHATAESKSFWQKQPGVEFTGSDKNIFIIPRQTKKVVSLEQEAKNIDGVPVFRGQSHEGLTAFDNKNSQRFLPGMSGTSFSLSKDSALNYGNKIVEGVVPNNTILRMKDLPEELKIYIKSEVKKLEYDDYVEGTGFEKIVSSLAQIAKGRKKNAIDLTEFFPKSKIDDEIRVLNKEGIKVKQ